MLTRSSFVLLLILLQSLSLFAQNKQDNFWYFSNNSTEQEGMEGISVTFYNKRQIGRFQTPIQSGHNNTSIANDQGELLFYSNGCFVIDSTHNVMTNGDNINPGYWNTEWCLSSINSYPFPQSSIILPDPGNENGYYYIHSAADTMDWFEATAEIIYVDHYYSYISFDDNPLGKVTIKNERYVPQFQAASSMTTACRHANGRDWWFHKQRSESDTAYQFLISDEGISIADTLYFEEPLVPRSDGSHSAAYSPDGTQYALFSGRQGLRVHDFDRTTGRFSNYRSYEIPLEKFIVPTTGSDCKFSPNSRFVYVSAAEVLYQVDTWDNDLDAAVRLIDTFDGFYDEIPLLQTKLGRMANGPDCKIYMGTGNGTSYLHVIRQPDELGTACDFVQHAIRLPHYNDQGSMPNFPHFRVGSEDVCDPTITSIFGVPIRVMPEIEVWPSPTTGQLDSKGLEGEVAIIDVRGQRVLTGLDPRSTMDVSMLRSGVYFVVDEVGHRARFVKM